MEGSNENLPAPPVDSDWVLSFLERNQLAGAREHHLPRRRLKSFEILTLWALRVYLLFMLAVIVYQLVRGNS